MAGPSLADRSIWRLDTFYAPPGTFRDRAGVLTGAEGHHLASVVRKRPGELVRVIDGEGFEAIARVERVAGGEAALVVVEAREHERSWGVSVVLAQAVLKGRGLEEVVRRASEIGVSEIVPVITARVVGGSRGGIKDARIGRLRAVALAATKQSCGVFVPRIAEARLLAHLAPVLSACDLSLVAWEEEEDRTLREALTAAGPGQRVGLVVGPEGGLEGGEVASLLKMGAVSVGVGRRILRADWAGAAIAVMVSHEVGGLLP